MRVSHDSKVSTLELRVVETLCKSINTPRSLAVALLIQYSEFQQLVDLKIDSRHYSSHDVFSCDYLVTSILSKNPRLPLSVNRRDVAIAKFYAAEDACRLTNSRISEFLENPQLVDSDIRTVIFSMQSFIQEILGPFPTRKDLAYAEENMRFGPGATTSVSGVVTQGKKYSLRTPEVTSRLLPFRTFCFPDLWKENVQEVSIRDFSKLAVVPKNAKTDRVICIEPDLNIFVQLGTGALIKRKLLRSGLDLSSQLRNQELAMQAHRLQLATVDLSAASDTISREAVWLLLPPAWADLLHFSRVDSTEINGDVLPLEKWSSMGNGYTFELETLIFFALAKVCARQSGASDENVTAYGDDIIIPRASLGLLMRTLDFLGFSVNREKTFGEGRFHESCGADYFDGHNVRPVFFRSEHHDFQTICYLYANNLRRWARRLYDNDSCDSRVLPAWLRCFTAVEPAFRYFIPEGFGDQGFIESFDRSLPSVLYDDRRRGWAGYNFRYRSVASREAVIDQKGAYFAFLNGTVSEFRKGSESLRGRFRPPKTEVGYVLDWPNLGP
ncbi:TPA_asm: RNA-directed RNA polymerase, partial [ssRNA phage Gerhypos.4_50]